MRRVLFAVVALAVVATAPLGYGYWHHATHAYVFDPARCVAEGARR